MSKLPVYKYRNIDIVKELTRLESDLTLDPEEIAELLGISFYQYSKFKSGSHQPGVSLAFRIGLLRGMLMYMHPADVTRQITIQKVIPYLKLNE